MWGWFLAFAQAALNHQSIDISYASIVTFVVVASGALGCVLGGLLADSVGRTLTTAGMMLLSGTCALVIGFTFDAPIWVFILVSIVWGITVIGDSAQFSAIVTEVGEPSSIGTALAFQLGIGFALTVVAIRIIPELAAALGGWQWTFLILAPGPFIGVAAMLLLRRMPEATQIAQGRR